MTKKTTYRSAGLVYGNYWGGGSGAFASCKYQNDDIEKMRTEIIKDIESGAIDSGMGYENVKGALMTIEKIETIEIDGKAYTNSEYEEEFFGDLSEKECEFLQNCLFIA